MQILFLLTALLICEIVYRMKSSLFSHTTGIQLRSPTWICRFFVASCILNLVLCLYLNFFVLTLCLVLQAYATVLVLLYCLDVCIVSGLNWPFCISKFDWFWFRQSLLIQPSFQTAVSPSNTQEIGLCQKLSVASGSVLPAAINSSYHVTVAASSAVGRSLWLVRWSRTHCLITSGTQRSALIVSSHDWKHTCFRCIRHAAH